MIFANIYVWLRLQALQGPFDGLRTLPYLHIAKSDII